MRSLIICFCLALAGAGVGCNEEKGAVNSPQQPRIVSDQAQTSGSESPAQDDKESWESKELKKMGITKDMSASEVMQQKNKLEMKDIMSWGQNQ